MWCHIRAWPSWLKKTVFCLVCFLAAGDIELRTTECYISACRGDIPGPYYASIVNFPFIAPTAWLESHLFASLGDHEVKYAKSGIARLGFLPLAVTTLTIDPSYAFIEDTQKTLEGSSESDEQKSRAYYEFFRSWARHVFIWHELIVLGSIPWWLLLYKGTQMLRKQPAWKRGIGYAIFVLFLITHLWITFFFLPAGGGEVDRTGEILNPWENTDASIPRPAG